MCSKTYISNNKSWSMKNSSCVALVVKDLPASAGDARDVGSIPGSGRSPGEGNGSPLQYSCLENPLDRGAWRATVHGVTKSQTCLNDWASTAQFCSNLGEGEVAQSCRTLCDPMDCSLPGSSVHGIFQAIVLEWIAISFSRNFLEICDNFKTLAGELLNLEYCRS